MINFSLQSFMWALVLLRQEAAVAGMRASKDSQAPLSESDLVRFRANLKAISEPLEAMFIAEGRLGRLATMARLGTDYISILHELTALDSDIMDAVAFERFYHYPRDKGLLVLKVPGDWATTLKAFPQTEDDIKAAVDCYALGHDRASIHHSMMILEAGLTALAVKFGIRVKPNKSTWGPLIDDTREAISKDLDKLAKPPKGAKPLSTKAAAKKRAFLEIAQEAALDLRFFKNIWRDHIAHGRGDYDENDAKKALDHVRSFMEIVSTKLKLKPVRITS